MSDVAVPPLFQVVAVGTSAGGVEALHVLVGALPAEFPAAVLVVLHLDPRHRSILPELLARHSRLPVKQATHGESIRPGVVYVAPPDVHMLLADGKIELSGSKLVHFTRPSVDLLFESVAGTCGTRAIGVILTGSGVDGATGVQALKRTGGVTLAQDPQQATYPGMPRAACATGSVDRILPLEEIAPALVDIIAANADARPWLTDDD